MVKQLLTEMKSFKAFSSGCVECSRQIPHRLMEHQRRAVQVKGRTLLCSRRQRATSFWYNIIRLTHLNFTPLLGLVYGQSTRHRLEEKRYFLEDFFQKEHPYLLKSKRRSLIIRLPPFFSIFQVFLFVFMKFLRVRPPRRA